MDLITIEPLVPQQFELVAGWLSRNVINRWLSAEWRGRVATPTLLAIALRNPKNRLFLVRCNGQPCGLTALSDINFSDATAMVWYILGDPSLSGQGITSDAL